MKIFLALLSMHKPLFRHAHLGNIYTDTNTNKKEERKNYALQSTSILSALAVMKSLNVIAPSTDVSIFPPAAQALSPPKAISSAGLESGWQLWKKQCGCPDIHQLAWTILGGRKETGSSDHLSL